MCVSFIRPVSVGLNALQTLERLEGVKKDLRENAGLKQQAISVSKARREIRQLEDEISGIQTELLSTGSTKTVDDLQREREGMMTERYVN